MTSNRAMQVLGYNSNLHPAESIDALIQKLDEFAGPVRRELNWSCLGVDLRLGSEAIHECMNNKAQVQALRTCFERNQLSAHTINAFPLSAFQTESVKENAYIPDWSRAERLADSIALIDIALALCDDDLITISTLPLSFKPWSTAAHIVETSAQQLGQWVAAAAQAYDACGRTVHLAIEPEPWCLLENSAEVIAFWQGPLATHGVAACAAILGDEGHARAALKRHLGICFDTCHVSLAYEDQAVAVQQLTAHEIPILKVQFSAAPELNNPAQDAAGVAALAAMAEPRFLHQTAIASDTGSLWKVVDLDELPSALAHMPQATCIRSHFHIPIFWPTQNSGVSSTIEDSIKGLRACIAAGAQHIAVETYTWSVLADTEQDALSGTVKELAFLQEIMHA